MTDNTSHSQWTSDPPLVTVVVTTKNSEQFMAECLGSVTSQSYPNVELVVVDNASEDRTCEIARDYTDKVVQKGPERSTQRNHGGLTIGQGDFLVFLDSDNEIEPDLIREGIDKFFEKPDLAALYIPLRKLDYNWISQAKGFEREFLDGTCIDAVRFIRREAFQDVGGYDETICGCEDWDLSQRLKSRGEFGAIQSRIFQHEDPDLTLKQYLGKMKYYSQNIQHYRDKWGEGSEDVRKQFSVNYRFFTVFLEQGKWKKLLAHPILTIKMFWLRVLVGFVYLRNRNNILPEVGGVKDSPY